MALFKSSVRKKIDLTPYTALEFEVSCGEGRRFVGKVVSEYGAVKPVFDWTATYNGEDRWDVLPAGGPKGVDRGFTKDPLQNRAIKFFIAEELVSWRNAKNQVPTVLLNASSNGILGETVLQIPLDEIVCFQRQTNDPAFSGQPRKVFDENDLQKLAGSLKKHGQKVPALVRRIDTIPGKKWELIAGERRWRALQHNGFPYLLAIEERPESKKQQHMIALVENLFRVDPSPLELSDALQEQINAGETQVSLAEEVNLSRATIGKLLSIQALHPELKPLLGVDVSEEERIRLEEANALGKIHPDHQVEIWNQAKGQPNHRLILAKIHQLGRSLFIRATPRGNRHLQAYQAKERLKNRLNALNLALIELKAVTSEEWQQFATLREPDQLSADMSRLTEAGNDIDEIKGKISRAKVAVRSSALSTV